MSQGSVPHPAAPPAPGLLTTHGGRGAPDSKAGPGEDKGCRRQDLKPRERARAGEKDPPMDTAWVGLPGREGVMVVKTRLSPDQL